MEVAYNYTCLHFWSNSGFLVLYPRFSELLYQEVVCLEITTREKIWSHLIKPKIYIYIYILFYRVRAQKSTMKHSEQRL